MTTPTNQPTNHTRGPLFTYLQCGFLTPPVSVVIIFDSNLRRLFTSGETHRLGFFLVKDFGTLGYTFCTDIDFCCIVGWIDSW
jgi:hypothetical protein